MKILSSNLKLLCSIKVLLSYKYLNFKKSKSHNSVTTQLRNLNLFLLFPSINYKIDLNLISQGNFRGNRQMWKRSSFLFCFCFYHNLKQFIAHLLQRNLFKKHQRLQIYILPILCNFGQETVICCYIRHIFSVID